MDHNQCFSHGHLYVALSRVRGEDYIRVLVPRLDNRVKNIVIEDILDKFDIDDAIQISGPDFPDDQVNYKILGFLIIIIII